MTYPKNRKQKTITERFWSKVTVGATDACWLWGGAVSSSGYGVFQRGKRGELLTRAHRFSYELHYEPIPPKLLVMHSCNNKLCVNPAHLSVGTHTDNIIAAWKDGLRKSSKHIGEVNRKLTDELVKDLIHKHKARPLPLKHYASALKVSISCISSILTGKTWKHLRDADV